MADQELSFQHDAIADRCDRCKLEIRNEYFRLQQWKFCSTCAAAAAAQLKDSPSAFTKATVYGILAVVPGLAIYASISIATRWHIGYLAIGIAWFVAFAMKKGSGGRGGRQYQIVAALLTYSAVSLSAIPEALFSWSSERHADVAPEGTSNQVAARERGIGGEPANLIAALGALALVGLASPFLRIMADPGGAALGALLIFFAVQFAWRLMAGPEAELIGPFPIIQNATG